MSKVRKTRRARAVYERLLAQREREGLTFPELSERSGVPLSTLQEWARRLREAPSPSRAFVELTPTSPGAPVEIVLRSGRRVVLPDGRAFEGLAELVVLLESC